VRELKFLYALALATVIAASLGACAEAQEDKLAAVPLPPEYTTFSGSYLAGRFAQRQQDWTAAQDYMGKVLSYDSGNEEMIQRTFLLALGAGNYDVAKALAEKVVAAKKGGDELALIFLGCDALYRGDHKAALENISRLPSDGFGQYTKPLLTAWSLMGTGDKAGALKALSGHASPNDPTYRMHVGLMEELSGNMNAAASHYKVVISNGLNLHTAVMVANFFERYGQPEISRDIYRGLDQAYPYNPFINAMLHADPHRALAPNIARAAEGAALALFDLATLLYEKRAYDSAQVYGSLVRRLAPSSALSHMIIGNLAALHERFGEAIESYAAIDAASPVYWLSRIRMMEAYEMNGQADKAIETLSAMAEDKNIRVPALVSLGDAYRRQARYEEAVAVYNEALGDTEKVTKEQWPIVYARGMAEERLNHWNRAEKDLLQALAFQPDNPMILNFIAYSWASQGVNLHKALEYAAQAVALKPNDGYILDSYGWTLFRLSRYDESVDFLERAVQFVPDDSTLLDHLGDAYWQVGRYDDARFRWRHARDMSKDTAFQSVIEQKIKHGIAVPSQQARNDEAKKL
jgi:tetratricopeptide (TPR) repeat protein